MNIFNMAKIFAKCYKWALAAYVIAFLFQVIAIWKTKNTSCEAEEEQSEPESESEDWEGDEQNYKTVAVN